MSVCSSCVLWACSPQLGIRVIENLEQEPCNGFKGRALQLDEYHTTNVICFGSY